MPFIKCTRDSLLKPLQIVGGIVAIVLNVRRNRELDLRFRGFRPDGKLCGGILFIGIPSAKAKAKSKRRFPPPSSRRF